ncbi:3-oxoacyl-[acyl-carrier-protein] reductase FabG-like [Oppia nitens]|uniref:3-oxoacyl-[acyl-carrier-protein] reductase FabG-like n=1 Tax=Oppia nitens TaxID=1686743 RepID=UPI0023DA7E45|nr:3-oxoacyl-[acyl-carrier-protein] reductase FabG-like [Oppia nitens]
MKITTTMELKKDDDWAKLTIDWSDDMSAEDLEAVFVSRTGQLRNKRVYEGHVSQDVGRHIRLSADDLSRDERHRAVFLTAAGDCVAGRQRTPVCRRMAYTWSEFPRGSGRRSSSGIGEAVALKLWSMGASVVITGRDTKRIDAVISRCLNNSNSSQPATGIGIKQHDGDHHRRRHHQKAIGIRADLLVDTDIDLLVARVSAEFGGQLDILVNNAGMEGLANFVDDNCVMLIDQELNFMRAQQRLTRLLIPMLTSSATICSSFSSIVNVSAITEKAQSQSLPNMLGKISLDMFTKCLALELAPNGVRVNSVGPGVIATPSLLDHPVLKQIVLMPEFMQTIPLGRLGLPDEVANAVAFLVVTPSEAPTVSRGAGSFITGIKLNITGGQ